MMNIILGEQAAQDLRGRYTVLELETVKVNDQMIPAFCVVDGEQLPVMELPMLERHKELHADFVKEYLKGNHKFCLDAAEHLRGKFGGQLDTFYDEIVARIERSSLPRQS